MLKLTMTLGTFVFLALVLPVFILLVLIVLAQPALAEENWPQFRGPYGDGHSDASDTPTRWSESESIKWKTAIAGRGWASPVIWGDQIWMTTASEDGKTMSAIAVDRQSGKIVHDLEVFQNEKLRFKHAFNSFASPTPVIEAGRVYVHFGSYGTACLDTASGKTLWARRDLECDHFRGPGSSPMLFGDLLITHYDGADVQYLVALDKTTGKTVWKTDRSNDYQTDDGDLKKAYSTPLVIEANGRRQLISPGSRAVTSYDPLTGKEFWQVTFKQFSSTARPLFGHGLLFINTGFGKAQLWAIRPNGDGDVSDTHVVWRVTKSVGSKPSPLLIGELLYMVHDSGVATCLEAKTGKVVWNKRLGGNYSASPIVSAGNIYFCSQQGKTTVVRPGRKFKQVAVNSLDDGFMASPAAVGRSLYLRTETHLYRVEQ